MAEDTLSTAKLSQRTHAKNQVQTETEVSRSNAEQSELLRQDTRTKTEMSIINNQDFINII